MGRPGMRWPDTRAAGAPGRACHDGKTSGLFDVTPAYEEWDRLHPQTGMWTAKGERAYQAELGGGGAHPADGFPVRITIRE